MAGPIEVRTKDPEVFDAVMEGIYHYKLVDLTSLIIKTILSIGVTPVVTSAFRHDSSGVHGCGRGMDFRSRDMTPLQIKQVCATVNSKWKYDPKRPKKVCLWFHDSGQGPHLHAQVHPNTVILPER